MSPDQKDWHIFKAGPSFNVVADYCCSYELSADALRVRELILQGQFVLYFGFGKGNDSRAPLKIGLRSWNRARPSKSRSEKRPIMTLLATLSDELLRCVTVDSIEKEFLEVS